ncbi:unnamed protein product [Acanthoscelides obtectus]|uniref:Transposase n=1 Tax=Acanthoscelides obtectus TaxID=200917 RepID=A0A9P0PIW8_ACAOB|nr:unnamed protein product [Acanthoscelides obtectus]CAK1666167.1 Histone-lysine N-methyltransferase SETMAR [Acanthoscelides obtectus]
MEFNREHFRAIIYYNFQRQLSQQECLAGLLSVFGNEAPHQSTISRWYGEFKRGRVNLSDEPRVGAPKMAVTQENVDAVRKLIIEDRHVTYREIEASLKISKTSIQKILHEELGVRKLVSRWIPHLLTEEQKAARVNCIVNGDESWIYCYEPENKRQSTVWVFQDEETTRKVIRSRSVSKKRLRKIKPERRIILHQDNASSHTAQRTRQYLTEENMKLLDHPPYSPDLSPTDFFTFPKIKNRLRGKRFQSPEEAVDAFKNAVLDLPANEWNKCFENWFERMQIRIYKNGAKIKNTFRALRQHFGRNNRPNETTIGRLVRKFEATGSVANLPGSGRPRSVRTPENIAVVKESVRDDPKQSTTRRSQELGISRTSLLRILHKDLNVHAYKIQLTQELRRADHFSRRTLSDWLLEHRQIDANFSSKIMFSDEAHFTLNGTVNKQNCRIWANENPREYQEQPMHPQKVTVWCALWSKGIIGPYFFENAAGDSVTVNSERYHVMIEDCFLPQLEGMDMDDVHFQQDGATCHTTNVNIHRLQSFFGDRAISRRGNVPWPPRSCDLTPLDFFLWGYLKSKVYVNKPATLQELKNNIIAEINSIEPTMLQNFIENFDHRVDVCKSSRGEHLSDIIFHA